MEMNLITMEDTKKLAESVMMLAEKRGVGTSTATIIGLWGNLGAGKTTFTQEFAKVLGINEDVTSPTFVIEKIYSTEHHIFKRLIHIDAYRLESASELQTLGWDTIVANRENLIVVEWPEKIAAIWSSSFLKISLEIVGSGRKAIVEEV
jgi:tRNA threonylcarbamoyladenosine biosynthesis protein TsaE